MRHVFWAQYIPKNSFVTGAELPNAVRLSGWIWGRRERKKGEWREGRKRKKRNWKNGGSMRMERTKRKGKGKMGICLTNCVHNRCILVTPLCNIVYWWRYAVVCFFIGCFTVIDRYITVRDINCLLMVLLIWGSSISCRSKVCTTLQ